MQRERGKNVNKKAFKKIFLPLDPDSQPRVTKMILESDRLVVEAEMPLGKNDPMLGRIMRGIPVNMSMAGRATVREHGLSLRQRAWRWIRTKILQRKPKKEPPMVVDFQATHLEFDFDNSLCNFGEEHEKDIREVNQEVTSRA